MRPDLNTPSPSSQLWGFAYSKVAEVLFIGLLLVYLYPFFYFVSGIDPTTPIELQSESKVIYYLQMAFPCLCMASACVYRGSAIILYLPRAISTYAVICLMSSMWSVSPYGSLKAASLLVLYTAAIAAVCQVLDIEVFCRSVVKTLAFTIIASVVVVVAFPRYGTHQAQDAMENLHHGLWRGAFVHKNLLGATAAVSVVIFVLVGRLLGRSIILRAICITSAISCIIFAQSAGAAVSILVILLYHALVRVIPATGSILLILVASVCALAYVSFLFFSDQILVALGRNATFTGRIYIWEAVLDLIWQRPILGFGYGAATTEFAKPILTSTLGIAAVDAHNGYLDALLGTGTVGLISLVLCIMSVIATATNRVKTSSGTERDCLILLLSFPIAASFLSFFEVHPVGGVQGTLGTLTYMSFVAIPYYVRKGRG